PVAQSTAVVQEHETEGEPATDAGSEDWDREQKRLHHMNVAAVFGGEEAEEDDEPETPAAESTHEESEVPQTAAAGTSEEEEIDEEEAEDLVAYAEELHDEAAFDDVEEETHSAGDYVEGAPEPAIAASAEDGGQETAFSSEPVSEETVEVSEAEETIDEAAAEDAELEQAQAEAEALLDSEGVANGTVDARAEVR